jgi:hypothetical protein
MRSVLFLPLLLVCSAPVVAQSQSISVKFSESKSHLIITIKTAVPVNPGVYIPLKKSSLRDSQKLTEQYRHQIAVGKCQTAFLEIL